MIVFVAKALATVFLAYLSLILAIIAWCFGDVLSFICFIVCIIVTVIITREFKKEFYRVWNNPWL